MKKRDRELKTLRSSCVFPFAFEESRVTQRVLTRERGHITPRCDRFRSSDQWPPRAGSSGDPFLATLPEIPKRKRTHLLHEDNATKLTLTGAYREGTERARAPFSHTEKKGTSRASLSHPHLLFCLSPALPSSTCAGGVTFYFGMSFDISAMCLDTASTSLRHAPMFPASCRISARERIRGCAQVHSTVPFRPSIFP